ncbi:MAG TPA: oxidoreductase [Bryobacteraceae bacterium]|nr:oxidoreductase [Bryobacteraceae bacterium]
MTNLGDGRNALEADRNRLHFAVPDPLLVTVFDPLEEMMKALVWFVTGASRGFGLEIARAALNRGDSVVAAARDPRSVERALGQHEQLLPVSLDVTNEQQAQAAVAAALAKFGQIDVLVNNAGRGLVGAVEETSAAEVRSVFAVNVDGLLTVSRAVLPSMRERRAGRILNLSSVGGFASWPGWGVYCATKFAVEGLSEAMHAELLPLGIHVTVIEPGPFRTDFLDASSLGRVNRVIEDYKKTAGTARDWADSSHSAQPGDPVKGAAAIIEIGTAENPPVRLQLGADSVAAVEAKLTQVAEIATWRKLAESTGYGDKV